MPFGSTACGGGWAFHLAEAQTVYVFGGPTGVAGTLEIADGPMAEVALGADLRMAPRLGLGVRWGWVRDRARYRLAAFGVPAVRGNANLDAGVLRLSLELLGLAP